MLDDIREWISDNLRYILLGIAGLIIILIIILVVRLVTRPSGDDTAGEQAPAATAVAVQEEGTVDGAADDQAAGANADADYPVADGFEAGTEETFVTEKADPQVSSLVKDDTEILTLMREYYTARAGKDLTALSQIVTPWDSNTQNDVLQSDLIESYNEITTYSEEGANAGEYVVFTCFKAKIPDYETLVPSLRMQYLVTEEDELKVLANYEQDAGISAFVTDVAQAADVQQLLSQVNAEYEAALNSDAGLKAYLTDLTTDAGAGEEEQQAATTPGETRTALYGLNIRQETSTESAVLGTVEANAQVEVLEDVADGWTRISYDPGTGAITGYVRTEYLS